MPDPLLQLPGNGTAGQPAVPLPDDRPDTEEATPSLMNLGSDGAGVCVDGVCVL